MTLSVAMFIMLVVLINYFIPQDTYLFCMKGNTGLFTLEGKNLAL
jgi:hypothetical protein